MTIDRLAPGLLRRLSAIGGTGAFRRRLMEMGFLPGTSVRVVRRVEIGGVLEVEVRGCRVSIRTIDAQALVVQLI